MDIWFKLKQTLLSKLFFYALVFLLPFGTGKIHFTSLSFFYGYYIFYQSFWLYLTDLVFFGVILAWIWESRKNISFHNVSTALSENRLYQLLGLFWLISLVSFSVSREITLSFYGLWKISEYLLLFLYIRENLDISREIYRIFWLILAAGCLESALAIVQYVQQTSFGLNWAGESFLRPGLKGVAEFTTAASGVPPEAGISHEIIKIRAYGTFPHPNVLGGFLLLAFMTNIALFMRKSMNVSREILLGGSLILISTGLVVSFSRNIWVATVVGLIIFFAFSVSRETKRKIGLLAAVLVISLAINFLFFGQEIKARIHAEKGETKIENQESYVVRQRFASISRGMIRTKPVFGVGLRNFVARMDEFNRGDRLLPYLHQPVHDIYLLTASEIGLPGLIVLLGTIFYIVRPAVAEAMAGKHGEDRGFRIILIAVFAGFLFIGFFDHYLFTIQQGGLMFWLTAGLLVAKN